MAWPTPLAAASITQQRTLATVPKLFAAFSFLGSLYIVVDVWRLSRSKRKAYHRILMGMSVSDCISSLAWFCSTWPIPPDVLPIWGARGTQATCALQGFFTQSSIATVLYSGHLAVYYFLVIRCGWKESQWNKSNYEWIMHIVVLSFAIGTSSAATAMGLMNPIGWGCWIAAVPLGCEESWLNGGETTCIRGDNANLFQWVFYYVPLWITIFGVTAIMICIVWKFRLQERSSAAWRHKSISHHLSEREDPSAGGLSSGWYSGQKTSVASSTGATNTRRRSRVRELVWQCLFYVGGFYYVWTFPTLSRIAELTGDVIYYHWVQLSATFITTQGMINLIVYLRPQYLRVRAQRRRLEEQQSQVQQQLQQQPQPQPQHEQQQPLRRNSSLLVQDGSVGNSIASEVFPARDAELGDETNTTTMLSEPEVITRVAQQALKPSESVSRQISIKWTSKEATRVLKELNGLFAVIESAEESVNHSSEQDDHEKRSLPKCDDELVVFQEQAPRVLRVSFTEADEMETSGEPRPPTAPRLPSYLSLSWIRSGGVDHHVEHSGTNRHPNNSREQMGRAISSRRRLFLHIHRDPSSSTSSSSKSMRAHRMMSWIGDTFGDLTMALRMGEGGGSVQQIIVGSSNIVEEGSTLDPEHNQHRISRGSKMSVTAAAVAEEDEVEDEELT